MKVIEKNCGDISVLQETTKGYKEIKSNEPTKYFNTFEYIAQEFEKAHNESEFADYDSLLSEVFGCSENDINIYFDITDDIQSTLEKFQDCNWERLNDKEKLSTINELEQKIGNELGMGNVPEIIIDNRLTDAYGFYDSQNGTIVISGKYLNDAPETVDTVAHELRHAYQHMRAEKCETREDALFRVNFENYIEPIPLASGGWLLFTDYYNQYVEVDARAFANIFREAMK